MCNIKLKLFNYNMLCNIEKVKLTQEDEDEQWSAIDNTCCVYITGSIIGDLVSKNNGVIGI